MKTKREIVLGFFELHHSQKIDIITAVGYFKDYHLSRGNDLERFKQFLHHIHEDDTSTFYEGLAPLVEQAKADNVAIADPDARLLSPTALSVEAMLLKLAPSYQGGNSVNGREIAEVFSIPFPIQMTSLMVAAKQMGHDPEDLWPWLIKSRVDRQHLWADIRRKIIEEDPSIDDIANEFMETNDGA